MKNIYLLLIFMGLASIAQPQPTKRLEFTAPETYPEGVAYSPSEKVFYVTSARLGTAGKVDEKGNYKQFYSDPKLKSTYGVKVASDGKKVYVCASDANYSKFSTPATKKTMGLVLVSDASTGKKVAEINLENLIPGEHFVNDLTLDDKGNAFVTDSFANVIYKIDAKYSASVFCKSDMFLNNGVGLNGIAFNSKDFLIVASSGKGSFFKVDVLDGSKVQKITVDQFFPGADGLLMDDAQTLIVVENGGVNKIFKLRSSDDWKTAEVLSSTGFEDRFSYPSTAATTP